MSIDFFKRVCKFTSNKNEFGLCDDPSPSANPAYIDEVDASKWIGEVKNLEEKQFDFYAIDHCIDLLKPNGKMDSRCDGLLHHDNSLIFVELKQRKIKGSEWIKDGRKQLKITIDHFKTNHDIKSFEKVVAYVCNRYKPKVNMGHSVQLQMFKDETGFILRAQKSIII